LLKKTIADNQIKRWIYLGQNYAKTINFRQVLGDSSEEVGCSREMYLVSDNIRNEFVSAIDKLSLTGLPQKEWLFSAPAVKNPYLSDLYLNVCYFFAVKKIMETKDLDLIIVDSPALADIIKANLGDQAIYPRFNKLLNVVYSLKRIIFSLAKMILFYYDALSRYFCAKLILKDRSLSNANCDNLYLIRNYIIAKLGEGNDDVLENHYFPGLYDYLKEQGKCPAFLPIVVNTRKYFDLYRSAKQSKKQIIFIEEFLRINDYLSLLVPVVKVLLLKKVNLYVGSVDFTKLCREDIARNISSDGYLNAHLYFSFGRRLKENQVKIKCFINWSEFQDFEKGLIAGLRENFPQLCVIGSQPFMSPINQLSLFLSKQDEILKIIPDRFLVMGKIAKDYINKLNVGVNVDYTPIFRYSSVYKRINDKRNPNDLIVLFGYGLENTVSTIDMLVKIKDELKMFDKILLKFHPASKINKGVIEKYLRYRLPKEFLQIDGTLEDSLKTVRIGVCGATGAAVELVCHGIPVIVSGGRNSLTMNYLALKEEHYLWRLCFNECELKESLKDLNRILQEKPGLVKEKAEEFRKSYFNENSEQYFKNYIVN